MCEWREGVRMKKEGEEEGNHASVLVFLVDGQEGVGGWGWEKREADEKLMSIHVIYIPCIYMYIFLYI